MVKNKLTENEALSLVQKMGLDKKSFSEADWNLHARDSDRFSSIANYKADYSKAGSEEERNRIHNETERLRKGAGYSAGRDGRGYYITPAAPGQFSYEDAPKFSYDLENDEVYKAYKNRYMREGQRAASDAVGNAAAVSGGIPSSYAASAAAQAGNYYSSQLADKVPELYEAAYGRYKNELSQHNADKNFEYGKHMDDIAHNNQMYDREWEEAARKAAAGDYSGYKDMGVNVDNNPLLREQRQAEYERQQALAKQENDSVKAERDYNLKLAGVALDSGDYGMVYDLLGIRVSKDDITAKEKLQAALFKAKMGDYTWLNQLMNGAF